MMLHVALPNRDTVAVQTAAYDATLNQLETWLKRSYCSMTLGHGAFLFAKNKETCYNSYLKENS